MHHLAEMGQNLKFLLGIWGKSEVLSMKKLGSIKNGEKNIFPLVTTRPRTMTFAEYQLLTPEQKQGEIIISDYPVPVEGDYVEVTADGEKTLRELLNELWDLIDLSKVSSESYFTIGTDSMFKLLQKLNSQLRFGNCTIGSSDDKRQYTDTYIINASTSTYIQGIVNYGANALAVGEYATTVIGIGTVYRIYYNSTKTLDIGTLAQNCMMSDGVTSVEDTLDDLSSIGTSYKITTISVTVATKTRERVSQKVTLNRGRYLVVTSQMIQDMSAINSYIDIRDADGTSYILSTGSLNVVGTFDITSDNTEVFASAYNNSSSTTITISAGDIRYAYWEIIKIK